MKRFVSLLLLLVVIGSCSPSKEKIVGTEIDE